MNLNSCIHVAGHTGLIGSAIVNKLQSLNYSNITTRIHNELDLTNKNQVEFFFSEQLPEYVVLTAGKVGGIVENKTYPADFINTNLSIQLNVLQAAQKYKVKKLIFFGSSCMYPRECVQPMPEESILTGMPEPTSIAYAISKLAGMQICLAYNQQYNEKRFIPIIPNSAFGPGDNFDPDSGHVLSSLIRKFHAAKETGNASITLWGSGNPRREFVYSEDIATAVIALLEGDTSELQLPINIGTGRDYSIKELAEIIAEVVGYMGDIEWDTTKPDGAPAKLLDSKRILKFGWRPENEFKNAVKKTYQWYLQNVVSKEQSHGN